MAMGEFLEDHPFLGCLGILALLGGLVYAGIQYGPGGWAWIAAEWEAYRAQKDGSTNTPAREGEKPKWRLPEGCARVERDGVLYTLGLPKELALPKPMPEDGPPPLLVGMMIQNNTYRPVEFTDAEVDWELVLSGPRGELARTRKDFFIHDATINPGGQWIENDILLLPPAEKWPRGIWRLTWTLKLHGKTVAEVTAETRYDGEE